MPKPRLPWFKLWGGVTSDPKVAPLSDALFRTWVELLDAASQQPKRGRFQNRKQAAAVIRRPVAHVAQLVAERLIDETPDGLTIHDWDAWQRWREEDGIDTGLTPESPTNDYANGYANNAPSLRAKTLDVKKRDVETLDVETKEGERAGARPPSANGNGYADARGNPRVAAVIDAFKARRSEDSEIGLPVLHARDYSAIKHSTAPPELIAEVYDAVAVGDYPPGAKDRAFMQSRLNVSEAILWINGYVEWKAENAWRKGESA